MDLLNEQRSLIHTGRLIRQSDQDREDLFVMLFDNYRASSPLNFSPRSQLIMHSACSRYDTFSPEG